MITENIKYDIGGNGPLLILDTKGLSRGKNYTIGCELFNEMGIMEKKSIAISKVNTMIYIQ